MGYNLNLPIVIKGNKLKISLENGSKMHAGGKRKGLWIVTSNALFYVDWKDGGVNAWQNMHRTLLNLFRLSTVNERDEKKKRKKKHSEDI